MYTRMRTSDVVLRHDATRKYLSQDGRVLHRHVLAVVEHQTCCKVTHFPPVQLNRDVDMERREFVASLVVRLHVYNIRPL